jgi:predicted enzyme related to lactoylglutathione lyase
MSIQAVIAFANTTRPEEAKTFYKDVVGLPFVAEEEYALIFDLNGVMIRVAKAPPFTPHPFTVLGFKVSDIAAEARRLAEKGVRFERYPYFTQDELGVWSAPEGAKVAWFKDPDGNLLSLTQF